MRLRECGGLVAVLVMAGAGYGGELVVNGGFENPHATGVILGLTGAQLPGWTVVSGDVDLVENQDPFEGSQSVDLAGFDSGAIEQTVSTTPGIAYTLAFAYANTPTISDNTALLGVAGNSVLVSEELFHAGSLPTDMNWSSFSRTFTADSAATTIRFSALAPSGHAGMYIDGVSLSPVPEPSGVWLLAVGAGVAAWRARRRSVSVRGTA